MKAARVHIETPEPLPLTLWPATGQREGRAWLLGFGGNRHRGPAPRRYRVPGRRRTVWQAAKAAGLA